MKEIVGVVLIISGIILGVYLGAFVMLIGGIFQFVRSLSPFMVDGIAWGIIKVLFASLVGYLSAFLLILPGIALIQD